MFLSSSSDRFFSLSYHVLTAMVVEKVVYRQGAICLLSSAGETWVLCGESRTDTERWYTKLHEICYLVSPEINEILNICLGLQEDCYGYRGVLLLPPVPCEDPIFYLELHSGSYMRQSCEVHHPRRRSHQKYFFEARYISLAS